MKADNAQKVEMSKELDTVKSKLENEEARSTNFSPEVKLSKTTKSLAPGRKESIKSRAVTRTAKLFNEKGKSHKINMGKVEMSSTVSGNK